MRYLGVLLIVFFSAFLAAGGPPSLLQSSPGVRAISLTQVIRIPIRLLDTSDGAEKHQGDEALTISAGGKNEPPEGPDGFDVFIDGRVLITDPLMGRVAVFDPKGKFLQSWPVGFAADSIKRVGNASFQIRQANSGEVHVFDSEGRERRGEKTSSPPESEVELKGSTGGTVSPPASADRRSVPLSVQFAEPGSRLISIEWLTTDTAGNNYVALESTAAVTEGNQNAIRVNKGIRKYQFDGKLVAEITKLPLDYYVPPVDELRVSNGMVYQLFTTSSEVRVNVWNMQ